MQLLLRQGQVEVEEGDFVPDYSTSVLVHRGVIEELNKEIKVRVMERVAVSSLAVCLSPRHTERESWPV